MLEQQLVSVGEAFIQKVLGGDYEIIETYNSACEILFDDKYKLRIMYFQNYNEEKLAYLYEILDSILTTHIDMNKEEKIKAYKVLMRKLKKYMTEKGKAEKLAEIERLQAEIENL